MLTKERGSLVGAFTLRLADPRIALESPEPVRSITYDLEIKKEQTKNWGTST